MKSSRKVAQYGLILLAMTRRVVLTFVLSVVSAVTAIAQVKITLPVQRYKVQEEIHAEVEEH